MVASDMLTALGPSHCVLSPACVISAQEASGPTGLLACVIVAWLSLSSVLKG